MALHNLVFVIDVDFADGDSGVHLGAKNYFVKRGILQILLHFRYKYGFEKVRWGYRFFQSKTGRNTGLVSRMSDFKELRHKTFEDFEIEFDAKFGVKVNVCSQRKHSPSQSASVQNAIKETLLDFGWDRPDITSPTKLSLRPRKSRRTGDPSVSQVDDTSSNGRNVVFIVSKCPHSRTQLLEYLSLVNSDINTDVAEHIMSRGLRDMLIQRQVVLNWIDSRSHLQISTCNDYIGSDKLSEVLALVSGRVIPVIALLDLCCNSKPDLGTREEAFAFKPSIGYLLSSEQLYHKAFPVTGAVLRWGQGDVAHRYDAKVEPVSCSQRLLSESVDVGLKGVLQGWDATSLTQMSTESWVLCCFSSHDQGAIAFLHLLMQLSAYSLHLLAEVNDSGLVCSAVLSPLSQSTALLTVLQPGINQHNQLLTTEMLAPATAETSNDLPDVVSNVLGVVYDIMEKDSESVDDKLKDHHVSEWAQQEVSCCSLTADVLETWFPQSDQSGVSSHLMESIKFLHAVPEKKDEELMQEELFNGLAELYQSSQGPDNNRAKKRGAQCTPVKQRMKTMSRSLQMLNVARLNVKAQKNQTEDEQQVAEGKVAGRAGKRKSSDKNKSETANTISFTSEAELLSHLKSHYEKTVAEMDSSLLAGAQHLMSAIKTFFMAESHLQVKTSVFVQQHLLKTSKLIRQLYATTTDADSKVRQCQLQAMLRLELCRLFSSEQCDSLDSDQMAEEVAEMLRIISLTKDPVCLTRFLQDEVLPGFLTAVPRTLADIYHSLGTQLPEALVAVLPTDFFSDESIAKDSISPPASMPPSSSLGLDGKDCLQDLRNRSANRRSGLLTRHRSMTESSQTLRQVEMPKKITRASKSKVGVALQKPVAEPQPLKQQTQEVIKVRRNLFNQETVSLSKKARLPRSQSVSTMEGLKRKRSHESEERRILLTKKVCETPLHKQVSSRLLHCQKMGRKSVPSEECIVEESPVKPAKDPRRSPRLKKFARRHSNTFYSSSQPRSHNLERALSASQLTLSDGKISRVNIKTVCSPMRLLFGAAGSPSHSSDRSCLTRTVSSRLSTDSSVFESPNKTPTMSTSKCGTAIDGSMTHRTPRTPRTQVVHKTPPSSSKCVFYVAQSPGVGSSDHCMALRGSTFRSPARKTLLMVKTPTKQSPMRSPLKSILRTPVKALVVCSSELHKNPVSRTPRKCVTWSPAPQKCKVAENSTTFKVPESPHITSCNSQKLVTPNKFHSQVNILRISENASTVVLTQENDYQSSEKLHNRLKTPEKCGTSSLPERPNPQFTQPLGQQLSHTSNTRNQNKAPSPTRQMITRSARTPSKSSNSTSPCKLALPLEGRTTFSGESNTSETSPAKSLTRMSLGQGATTARCSLRSQSSENFACILNTECADNAFCRDKKNMHLGTIEAVQTEPSQSSEADSSSHTDSLHFDSSHLNSASTDDTSLDIVDAAVVKTQFSGGLKMNISFSRMSLKSNEDILSNLDSPKLRVPPQSTPGQSYGFRQTPDRQQREAAARLGYGNDSPRFSTPRGLARPNRQKGTCTPHPLTYQVEMEMQKSGLPKLKIKRFDSVSAGHLATDGLQSGAQSPLFGVKPYQLESPLTFLSKHRDPGCVSPSICSHVTPAKSTPGKGGSIQTYICQSYTPTHCSGGTGSPVAIAEITPLTPSPQGVVRAMPDNLNSWPRRKRAQLEVVGGKDRGLKEEPLLEEFLAEAELGVSRLQDFEDTDEPSNNKCAKLASATEHSPPVRPDTFSLSALEDLYWVETLTQQTDCNDPRGAEEEISWAAGNGDVDSVATTPSSKMRKSVTASGILALTQSPLLFKEKTGSASKKTPKFKNEAASGRMEADTVEVSPFSQPIRRSTTGKIYSRKRLLH